MIKTVATQDAPLAIPTGSCVEVSHLSKDALVEVQTIAYINK